MGSDVRRARTVDDAIHGTGVQGIDLEPPTTRYGLRNVRTALSTPCLYQSCSVLE
jgi:hypothetical protein